MTRARPLPALALSLVLLGSAAAAGCGARMAPSAASAVPTEVACQVDAVAYAKAPGQPARGSISPVRITLRPNPSRQVRVAVFEEYSGGTGEMWRAATWVGAIHASKAVGRSLGDYEVSVAVGGLIDGPSAGALITAGLMATMQSLPVRPDVTMTGTVNPDGTVGPVGGIAYKMQAAAAAGKRVFGYPRGSRFAVDADTGDVIDLPALASRLGLRAVEIGDIEEAFALLTDHQMPRPVPVQPSQMAISPELDARMRAQIGAWAVSLREGIAGWERQPGPVQELLRPTVERCVGYLGDAERFLRQGLVAMAYKRARDAAAIAHDLDRTVTMMTHLLRLELEPIGAEVQRMSAVEQEVEAYFASLTTIDPRTVGDALTLVNAYDYGLQARTNLVQAQSELARVAQLGRAVQTGALGAEVSPEEVVGEMGLALFSAINSYNTARVLITLGADGARLGFGTSSRAPLDMQRLAELAHSTTVAAKAVLDYHDAVTVQTLAEELRLSDGEVRARLWKNDLDYRSARTQLTFALSHRAPGSAHEALLVLAAANRAYVDSSLLVMRHYSLGVRMADGRPVSVDNDVALMVALEGAELRAREAAAVAVARLGVVPDEAGVMYERARMLREGDLEERLIGLRGMWMAAMVSRSASHLAASGPR